MTRVALCRNCEREFVVPPDKTSAKCPSCGMTAEKFRVVDDRETAARSDAADVLRDGDRREKPRAEQNPDTSADGVRHADGTQYCDQCGDNKRTLSTDAHVMTCCGCGRIWRMAVVANQLVIRWLPDPPG